MPNSTIEQSEGNTRGYKQPANRWEALAQELVGLPSRPSPAEEEVETPEPQEDARIFIGGILYHSARILYYGAHSRVVRKLHPDWEKNVREREMTENEAYRFCDTIEATSYDTTSRPDESVRNEVPASKIVPVMERRKELSDPEKRYARIFHVFVEELEPGEQSFRREVSKSGDEPTRENPAAWDCSYNRLTAISRMKDYRERTWGLYVVTAKNIAEESQIRDDIEFEPGESYRQIVWAVTPAQRISGEIYSHAPMDASLTVSTSQIS
ncbi:hypothetical protein HY469_01175 [Candidatus Roizmanbacteria bacterium]|nr:hypothetical protein [Candidatus Roizmanbacteria bacterium]